jgi:hypothetical protein
MRLRAAPDARRGDGKTPQKHREITVHGETRWILISPLEHRRYTVKYGGNAKTHMLM